MDAPILGPAWLLSLRRDEADRLRQIDRERARIEDGGPPGADPSPPEEIIEWAEAELQDLRRWIDHVERTEIEVAAASGSRTGTTEALDSLGGHEVAAVSFDEDALRIEFDDGSQLSCSVWPRVQHDLHVYQPSDDGYRDALCGFIGARVDVVECSSEAGIVIGSDDAMGAVEVRPPDDVQGHGREVAAVVVGGARHVWLAGQQPQDC